MFKLHSIDIAIIFCYLAVTIFIGFWISKRASKSIDNYFLGGNTIPWYMPWLVERLWDVRHQWHDVDGLSTVRLRIEKHLDPLVVAFVQSDIHDGVSLDLVAAVESHDRCRVDSLSIW